MKSIAELDIVIEPGDLTRYEFKILGKAIAFKTHYINLNNIHNVNLDVITKLVIKTILYKLNDNSYDHLCEQHEELYKDSTLREYLDNINIQDWRVDHVSSN